MVKENEVSLVSRGTRIELLDLYETITILMWYSSCTFN